MRTSEDPELAFRLLKRQSRITAAIGLKQGQAEIGQRQRKTFEIDRQVDAPARRALEDVEMAGGLGELRRKLVAARPRADHGDALAGNAAAHCLLDPLHDPGLAPLVGIDHGVDGSGAGICIVDTGIDPGHEQLDSKSIVWKDFVGTAATPVDDHGHGTHVASIAVGDGVGGAQAARFRGVAPAAGPTGTGGPTS